MWEIKIANLQGFGISVVPRLFSLGKKSTHYALICVNQRIYKIQLMTKRYEKVKNTRIYWLSDILKLSNELYLYDL